MNKRYAESNYLKIADYDFNTVVLNITNTNFNNDTLTSLESNYVNKDPDFPLQLCTNNIQVTSLPIHLK